MLWKLLVSSVRPYWNLLLGVVVFQFAQSMVNLYLPTLNADIIDNGVAVGDTGYIWRIGGLMLILSFVGIACTIAAVYFGAKIAMRVGRDLRGDIFERVSTFSEAEVQRFGAPSLITRSTNDVQQVQMLVLMTSTLLISAPFTAIGGVVLALQQDVQLSWIMAVAIPLLLIIVSLIVWRMVPHFRRMQTRIDGINRVLREQLTGIRVVRAFVREGVERERFADANALVTESAIKAGRLMASMFPLVLLVVNLGSVAVMWFGAERIAAGEMQVGALTAFFAYLIQILFSVLMATFLFVLVPRAAVAADRITDVLSTSSTVVEADAGVQVPGTGEVVFENVTFTYPGAEQPVLADISFTARRGTTTAIIGSTGAGKSTLVSLIPRLYDASAGTVRVGEALTCATPTSSRCGVASGSSRSGHTSSRAPSHRRCGSGARTPRTRSSGTRSRSLRARTSCARCLRVLSPRSPRAAPPCRAGSVSACRSPGRSCAGRTSSFSTTRSAPSTRRPTLACARPSRAR